MDELLFEYLTLLDSRRDYKQIRSILKSLSSSQTYKLKRFIRNVLNGQITLSDATYRELSKYKVFLRQINKKYNVNIILRNYTAFSKILKIMLLKKNGTHQKSSSNTLRRVEENEFQKRNKIIHNRDLATRVEKNDEGEKRYSNEENDYEEEEEKTDPTVVEEKKKSHIQKMMNPHTVLQLKKMNLNKLKGSGKRYTEDQKKYADSLLMFIRDKNIFKWNDKGEIFKKKVPIRKSNIKKLISHAISKKAEKPIGYEFFYKILKHFKIPNFL